MYAMDEQTHTQARILIVDDHPNTAVMLARVLSKFEFPVEVLTACSGDEALRLAGQNLVDILITDFLMPGMNGLELIEKFKGGREPSHTILITAYDTPGLALSARRLKIQDYLVKPVQPEIIRDIVSRVLQNIQDRKEQQQSQITSDKVIKVLIADDFPDNIRLLASRLKTEGYSYVAAEDGVEALAKLRSEMPDIVLLDVNMPKKDGFEVLAEIRADPLISHIPVLIVTAARIGPQDVREGLTLGADDYITKPFDWRELVARIQAKLRVKQAEDALRRRNQELGVLPAISRDLSGRLGIDELSETVLRRTVETLGAANAQLTLFLSSGQKAYKREYKSETHSESLFLCLEELVTQVSVSRQGLIIPDISLEQKWRNKPDTNTHSIIAVPLIGSRESLGVLILTHGRPSFFTSDHLSILQAISSQATIALENIQLLDIERKRVQELVALNQLAREISTYTQSTELRENLPKLIQQAMGYPTVCLWLMEDQSLKLMGIAGEQDAVRKSLLDIAPMQAAIHGQPTQISGPIDERTGERLGTGIPPVQSAIAVPLVLKNSVKGVLSIHSKYQGSFQESDRVVLETLASQVASAYERILLFESIEHERRRLSAVLYGAADAIFVVDADNRLQLVNPAGKRLFTDVTTQVGSHLPAGKGYDEFIGLMEEARQSATSMSGDISWPDGRSFSVYLTPIEEGGQVAILHDISQFKALDQIKNEFIATATHDLKNPIFAVLGYSDLIKKAGPLNQMQTDFIGRIRNASLQMQDLVLNLLEIARMEMSPELNMESVDMNSLVEGIVNEFHTQAEAHSHQLLINLADEKPTVRGDKTRLQQVVRNLISNAIKYTPDGGEINTSVKVENSMVTTSIQDTGIGIPKEYLPFIFDQFYRIHTEETQNIEGNGLGLAIVKSIIDKHRGNIYVESTPGRGSNFYFELLHVQNSYLPVENSINVAQT
jgi:signal transduction histidine kinase/DNA-binding response OmpR family regulator